MKGITYILLALSITFSSCKKKDVENEFSIKLIEMNPAQIIEFKENINVRIAYNHSQGFVGFSDPD